MYVTKKNNTCVYAMLVLNSPAGEEKETMYGIK